MDSFEFAEKLSSLEKQVKTLIERYRQLNKCHEQAVLENKTLKAEVEELRDQVCDFQNQDKITKIVSNTTVEKEESAELKHKLNEYIEEIDRCVAHLSQ